MIKVSEPDIGKEEINAAVKVLESGRLSDGPQTSLFQSEFAKFIGVPYCQMVSNGTFALEAVLRYYKIGKGDEVIVPPLTFFATVESVLNVEAKPVFADIDKDTWNIIPSEIENKSTVKTRAVIPVHIFGNPCNMAEIMRICRHPLYKLKVIEDSCQSHGSLINNYYNYKAGSVGDAGCFSFYATKNMTTGGEGGAVTTSDPDLASFISKYKNHGMVSRDEHEILGTNGRMSEIEAAIGRVQLSRLDEMNQIRENNSLYVREKLSKLSWLVPQKIEEGTKSCFFWNAFWVDEQKVGYTIEKLVHCLKNFHGIEVRHRYVKPLYHQKIIKNNETLPNAEKICGRIIGLPNHSRLSRQDLDVIVDVFRSI